MKEGRGIPSVVDKHGIVPVAVLGALIIVSEYNVKIAALKKLEEENKKRDEEIGRAHV